MALSPAAKRQKVFDELYEAAAIVPPRPLVELQPLFENGTLLHIGQVFGSIQQAETTVAEYCEVQTRAVVYNGQDGAYKNRTALSARCPQTVEGGTCSFRCRIRGNMRTRRFMCEELEPHNCTVLSTDRAFTGAKRCNYSRHMFAAIPALGGITQDNGAALLAQYTNTSSSFLRVQRVREAVEALHPASAVIDDSEAVEFAEEVAAAQAAQEAKTAEEQKTTESAAAPEEKTAEEKTADTEEKADEDEAATEEKAGGEATQETKTDEIAAEPVTLTPAGAAAIQRQAAEQAEQQQPKPKSRRVPRMLRELEASTPGSVAFATPRRSRSTRKRSRN